MAAIEELRRKLGLDTEDDRQTQQASSKTSELRRKLGLPEGYRTKPSTTYIPPSTNAPVKTHEEPKNYYSPTEFKTANDYNAWRSTVRPSIDDIDKELGEIDKQVDYWTDRAEAYKFNIGVHTGPDGNAGSNAQIVSEFQKLYDEAAAELKKYQQEKARLEEEKDWSEYFKYSPEALSKNEDWDELSKYTSTANGQDAKLNALTGTYIDTGFDDLTYDYINKNAAAVGLQTANDAGYGLSLMGFDDSFLQQMSDDEIATFNYLYALDEKSGDKNHAKAYEFIDYIANDLNYRQRKEQAEYWTQYASEHPIASSAFSVATAPMRGLSYVGQLADYAENGEVDPNAAYNKFSYVPSDIRGEVSKIAEDKWGKVGSFLYQTGMSMGDFLLSTGVSGGNSTLALAIMSTGSAADTTIDALNRGLSPEQSLALGAISGAAEALTEKASLDALLGKTKWSKSAIGYFLSNALSEGSEEMASEIINTFADILVAGDQSEWRRAIDEYMNAGYSKGEAFGKALRDKALEIGLAGLGGLLSGGVIGGVGAGVTAYANRTAQNTTPTNDALHQTALEAVRNAAEEQGTNDTAALATVAADSLRREAGAIANTPEGQEAANERRTVIPATENTANTVAEREQTVYTDIQENNVTEGVRNGTAEGIHLRDSSEWTDGENTGRQIRQLEEGAGRNQSWQTQGRSGDGEAASLVAGKRVTKASTGFENLVEDRNVRYVASGETVHTKEAQRIADERGLELALFTGGNLRFLQKDNKTGKSSIISARAYIVGNRMYVRADHPSFTADLLAKHEAGHDMIDKHEIDVNAVRKHVNKVLGKEKATQALASYVEAYAETGMTVEEIFEELICDSIAGMNVFAGTKYESAEATLQPEVKKAAAETKTETTRGPPATEGKASRETSRRARRGRSIEIETMENNRFQRLRQFGDNLPDVWYAYSDKYLYVYKNINFEDYNVVGKVPVINQTLANAVIEEVENDAIRTATDFNRRLKDLRSKAGRHSGDNKSSANRGSAVGNGGLSGNRSGESAGRNRGVQESGGDRGVTGKASRELDANYLAAVNRGDMETAQKMVEDAAFAAGYTVKAFHGTQRADRVGNVFRPDRATSGPMAFFTDNQEIAENYSKSKRDTSLAYDSEYDSYETQFRAKTKAGAKHPVNTPLHKAWGYVPMGERNAIRRKAEQLRFDWDGDNDTAFILDTENKEANGGFQWQLKEARGNVISALEEQWLNSGNLFNEEDRFLEVLDMVGVTDALRRVGLDVAYMNPDYREEKVYNVFLKIVRPFDATKQATEAFIKRFEKWAEKQNANKYAAESADTDLWDKRNVTAEDFAGRMRDDLDSKFSHAWTSIPDIVTDYLKHLKYDGIKDTGGKNGGESHTVWIPFESTQVKSADPVVRDDNGDVVPLSERFNPDKVDIRFSRELENIEELRKENAKLKEVNRSLREQFKLTKFSKPDKKTLDKFVEKLLSDYNSNASAEEVGNTLTKIFDLRSTDPKEHAMDWSYAAGLANELSMTILEGASAIDDSDYRAYQQLRDTIRKTAVSVVGIENIEDFKQENRGRIKITKSGTPVETFYETLEREHPDIFDSRQYVTPAERAKHIAEVLDEIAPQEFNPYSADIRSSAAWLASDILNRTLELPNAKPTFADKAQSRLDAQKSKGRQQLEKLREQKNERIASLIEKNREKVKSAVRKERQKRVDAVREVKTHYKTKEKNASENRKAAIIRKKIMRHVNEMRSTLLRPSDKHHVPEALRGPVARLLEAINLESQFTVDPNTKGGKGLPAKRTQAFAELRKAYAEIAGELVVDPDLLGDNGAPGLFDEVTALADKPIATMNTTELESIWQTLRAMEASIRSANKMFAAARFQTVSEAAEALRRDNDGKKAKVEYNYIGKLQKLVGVDMLTPEAFLHRLGDSGDAIFRMLRNAQDEHIRIMKTVADFTREAMNDVNVRALEKELHTVTLGGEEIKLSTAQLMELYVLMRREQAQAHILAGGILPDVVSTKGLKKITKAEPVRGITLEEVNEAVSLLTAEQMAVAKKLQDYASGALSDFGNKASMEVYNYKKFNEEHYWPIRSNRQETKSTVEKDTATTSVANRGFTKATKPNANTSVKLGSIFDTFSTHASEMATYAAWLGTTEDVNRIRNFTFRDSKGNRTGTVKGIVDRVHGSHGSAYLQKLLSDIANGVKGTHGETEYMSGIVGNYKAAAVGANLRVIIQQPTAILRTMDMIAPQYLVAGIRPGGWKKALRYAPIAQWKDWGYFDINTGRQMKDVLFASDSKIDKVKQASMWMAGKMDSLAWGQLWNAVESETKAKNKELKPGTEEFYKAVASRFTEIVDHTQVVDGILQRSQIMRSGSGLTKMATAFMGEPTKQYNMFLSAVYDAGHAVSKELRTVAKKRVARTAFALAVSGVVNAAVQSIVDAVRDDDEEKEYWEKWLSAFVGFSGDEEGFGEHFAAFWSGNVESIINPAQYIPYAKDVVSILQGYDVSRMDMESVEKTISAAQNMIKALSGEGKHSIAGASANLFTEVARLLGIPVSNLKREVQSFAKLAAIESENYLMQYHIEKALLNMNYAGNKKAFMDILYNAYVSDPRAYEIIYADLVKEDALKTESKTTEQVIASAMEDRMRKAQGVSKVSELEQRYLTPDQQAKYDRAMKTLKRDDVWDEASSKQRDKTEGYLYDLIVENDSGRKMQEKIDEGEEYGLDETDYLLYKLALSMCDEPTESGKLGSYTNAEVEAAIEMLGLSDEASSYLWLAQGKSEKNNPWK